MSSLTHPILIFQTLTFLLKIIVSHHIDRSNYLYFNLATVSLNISFVFQNTLENIPFFFGLLLGASLRHPWLAALFGAVFIVGRVKYSVGYYSGSPEGRVPGALISGLGGSLPLLGLSVSSAASFLGWW